MDMDTCRPSITKMVRDIVRLRFSDRTRVGIRVILRHTIR